MADTGALSPGTMADDSSVGTISWSDPNNAKASDDQYSLASASTGTFYSHYLKATNFGFAIPAGATIDGILVEIEKKKGVSGGTYSEVVKIIKADGTLGSTNKGNSTNWSSTEGYDSFGGATDLWDESWDADKINDVDFGVVLQVVLYEVSRCLRGDTLVWTVDKEKQIKDLIVGEKIYSFNEKKNRTEIDTVTKVWTEDIKHYNSEYYYIYLETGIIIRSTFNQAFYANGKWVEALDLKIGDVLKNEKLEDIKIINIDVVKNNVDKVWDLTVKNNHNFFANTILVHNSQGYVDHIRITVYYTAGAGATGKPWNYYAQQ